MNNNTSSPCPEGWRVSGTVTVMEVVFRVVMNQPWNTRQANTDNEQRKKSWHPPSADLQQSVLKNKESTFTEQ